MADEAQRHRGARRGIGSASQPDQPARLLDPLRSQPFQVILLDELEKAHHNVWDLLLPLLDEGTLTPPGGSAVNFRNTIVIATSNIGARDVDKSLGFGGAPDDEVRQARFRESLESQFRPELLNRFQHVVIFHHLTRDQVRRVARQELQQVLGREGITARNLVIDVDDEVLDHVIASGFDHRYGARALKREIQRQLVLPLAVTLMEREVSPGSVLKIVLTGKDVGVRVLETAETRELKRVEAPVRVAGGEKLGRAELESRVRSAGPRVEALAESADEPFLKEERERLVGLRQERDFWTDTATAALGMRDLDRFSMMLDRLERLRRKASELEKDLERSSTRRDVEQLAARLGGLEQSLDNARREMVTIGRDGMWDVLVEIRPAGGSKARDLLVDAYTGWARWRRLNVQWLFDPRADEDPAFFAIVGSCAYGYLGPEAGVHRVRQEEDVSVATVRTARWGDERGAPSVLSQRALKVAGQLGGKIRSRLECEGGLMLQNSNTLIENRELATEVAPSWSEAPRARDDIVRRYDLAPFLVRDAATGFTTGHPEALKPRRFHELLCRRIDSERE